MQVYTTNCVLVSIDIRLSGIDAVAYGSVGYSRRLRNTRMSIYKDENSQEKIKVSFCKFLGHGTYLLHPLQDPLSREPDPT